MDDVFVLGRIFNISQEPQEPQGFLDALNHSRQLSICEYRLQYAGLPFTPNIIRGKGTILNLRYNTLFLCPCVLWLLLGEDSLDLIGVCSSSSKTIRIQGVQQLRQAFILQYISQCQFPNIYPVETTGLGRRLINDSLGLSSDLRNYGRLSSRVSF
ncbi:hypothetical protein SCHPADRAFT_618501 [Schizopora paradoxa]|uniref:Uncharacterized protein n=1 Tax=Schizopora paradoxa TaxID=27342 RepID=A0A0H2RF54_9AGAM|nr:hypothetical protein SCHPADRAFT_618501 [Schizopora paradoxa]